MELDSDDIGEGSSRIAKMKQPPLSLMPSSASRDSVWACELEGTRLAEKPEICPTCACRIRDLVVSPVTLFLHHNPFSLYSLNSFSCSVGLNIDRPCG